MEEPQKIDVAYADGHWIAEVGPELEAFDCRSLARLIGAVQRFLAGRVLIFVIDQSTVEDYAEAEAQFIEAMRINDAVVISTADI